MIIVLLAKNKIANLPKIAKNTGCVPSTKINVSLGEKKIVSELMPAKKRDFANSITVLVFSIKIVVALLLALFMHVASSKITSVSSIMLSIVAPLKYAEKKGFVAINKVCVLPSLMLIVSFLKIAKNVDIATSSIITVSPRILMIAKCLNSAKMKENVHLKTLLVSPKK